MDELKEKNIIITHTENHFDKIQHGDHPREKLRLEGTHLSLIKGIYNKPTAQE